MEKISRFRLRSSAFDRPEERTQRNPKKVIVLSVDGDNTEKDYFSHLNTTLDSAIIQIEILRHKQGDGYSDPKYVVELLQEYINVRNGEIIPDDSLNQMIAKYSVETIKAYFNNPESISKELKNKIKNSMLETGIDIEYRRHLQSFKDDGDMFCVILDRDPDSHSRESLEECLKKCEEKEYGFYLSNPCFEFWLLLHLCDVKKEFNQNELDGFKTNAKVSTQHTKVSKEVSNRAHHGKSISRKKFMSIYAPNIHFAIEQAKAFSSAFPELFDEIGSNIPELLNTIGVL